MPEIFVPPAQGTPQVPGDDSYTYSYSVWGQPKQQEDWSETTPAYEYRSVAVCPWEAVGDPSLYRPEGSAPVDEAHAARIFGKQTAPQ